MVAASPPWTNKWGRLRMTLRTLRTLGIADDTIVFFASDNGPENDTPGSAGHLRGRKRSLYEGGVRVPGLVEKIATN